MKNILVLASTFPRWKNDTTPPFVLELEKRLAKDFNIFVLVPHFVGAKKKELLDGLHVTRFQYFWPAALQRLCYEGGIMPNLKKNKLLYVQAITLLVFEFIAAVKIIKKEKIQLVHAHWIIPQGIIALLIKIFFGIPYIVTTHGGDIYGLQNGVMKKIKKIVLENAKKITVVSTAIKEEIIKNINSSLDISVISMGVDTKLFNPDKYDEALKKKYNIKGPFLLFVGRLAEKKGVQYILGAMPSIILKFPQVKFLIIGTGTEEQKLKQMAKDMKLTNHVIFTGAIPNTALPKYYATADILVCPFVQTEDGDKEGLPVTILEGLASGINVITTDTGGLSDVIKTNYNGVIIRQKDSSALKQAINEVINDSKKRIYYKKHSIQTVKDFDWENVIKKYSLIFTS